MSNRKFSQALESAFEKKDISSLFNELRTLSHSLLEKGRHDIDVMDKCVRLAEKQHSISSAFPGMRPIVESIIRESGLFPYLPRDCHAWDNRLCRDYYTDPHNSDFVYHIEQVSALKSLIEGRDVILSAPTSFGKSVLIDATIRSKSPHSVVIIVPTIALLDETKRRLRDNFSENYKIITHPDRLLSFDGIKEEKFIIVSTQERMHDSSYRGLIDFLVIDEFYKAHFKEGGSKSEKDVRAITLNGLISSLQYRSKQIFMLGPTVHGGIKFSGSKRMAVTINTKYSPVTADIYDRTNVEDPVQDIVTFLKPNQSSLIYVQSPASADRFTVELANRDLDIATDRAHKIAG